MDLNLSIGDWIAIGSAVIAATGAIASWLPFYVKVPMLSLRMSVKTVSTTQGVMVFTPFLLVVGITNTGEKAAKNIQLKLNAKIYDSKSGRLLDKPEVVEKISGDLLPSEKMDILIPFNRDDTKYPHNHLNVAVEYDDSLPWRWRKHKRYSAWFFNVVSGVCVSEDLNRIDRVDRIPQDLLVKE